MHRIKDFRLEPLKNLSTLDVVGYEVLSRLRWGDDPEQYFSYRTPETLTRLFKIQQASCHAPRDGQLLFMNLPVLALLDETLCSGIRNVSPKTYCIEIQDPHQLSGLNRAENSALVSNLFQLKEKGYDIWLDDFDVSLTNTVCLLNFPFDGIKVDKHVLWDDSERLDETISTCLSLTKNVIVEGIETDAQMQAARNSGAALGQGYIWQNEFIKQEISHDAL